MNPNLPVPLPAIGAQDLELMARRVAESKLFPGIDTPQKAFALMLLCQAQGLHPGTAMQRYHVIQGRPAMRADAMLASFLAEGGRVRWIERTDQRVSAEFSHPVGGKETITWDLEQVKRAGLAGKDNWKAYPRQMLTARVISEAVRLLAPGVVSGIYAPEEVADFSAGSGEPPIDVEAVPEPEPEPSQTPVRRSFEAMIGACLDRWHAFEPIADEAEETSRKLRLVNELVTCGIKDGHVQEHVTLKPAEAGKGPVRDPRKAWQAAKALYETDPDYVRLTWKEYLAEKKANLAPSMTAAQAN